MLWVIILWTSISLVFEMIGFHLYPWSNYPSFPNGYNFPVPFGNLWFVYALLILSAYAALISKLPTLLQIVLTLFLSFAMHLLLKLYHFDTEISNMLFYNLAYQGLPFFTAGFLFKDFIVKVFNRPKKVLVVMTMCFLFMFVFKNNVVDTAGYSVLLFKYIPMTLIFVGLIVYISKIWFFEKIFFYVGCNSLEFFILHQFFIALFFHFYNSECFGYIPDFLISISAPIVVCFIFIITFKPFIKPLFVLPKSVSFLGQKVVLVLLGKEKRG